MPNTGLSNHLPRLALAALALVGDLLHEEINIRVQFETMQVIRIALQSHQQPAEGRISRSGTREHTSNTSRREHEIDPLGVSTIGQVY